MLNYVNLLKLVKLIVEAYIKASHLYHFHIIYFEASSVKHYASFFQQNIFLIIFQQVFLYIAYLTSGWSLHIFRIESTSPRAWPSKERWQFRNLRWLTRAFMVLTFVLSQVLITLDQLQRLHQCFTFQNYQLNCVAESNILFFLSQLFYSKMIKMDKTTLALNLFPVLYG